MNLIRSISTGILLSSVCVVPMVAQEVEEVPRIPVDRIVAIVGDTPIPLSVLQQQLNVYQQQGGEIPTDPEALRVLEEDLLQGLIDQELLVQAAERDTMVQVTEEEIQAAVDEIVNNVRGSYLSLADMQRELEQSGFDDLDAYRIWVSEQQRKELLQNAILQAKQTMGEITPRYPTDAELLDFYEERSEQFGMRPATVSFRQVVVAAQPDTSALAAALVEADSVRDQLLNGADFAEMARQHSDDPTTKETGGDLGWFRRGQGMAREFENVAFRLQPGFISFPVYTQFGFHLIEVQRAEPASVQARHILIAPTITEENREAAQALADSIVNLLRAGASYDSLADLYHEPDNDRVLNDIPRESMPPHYADVLGAALAGDVAGPVKADFRNGRTTFTVVIVVEVRPEGPVTFDDVKDQLRSTLAQQGGIERYLQSLRDATYIDIRL
jgi:peptidyl-prolyl cis-trans isomerase SurA